MGQSIWTPDHTMATALGAASHVCAAAGAFTSDDPRQRRPDISKAKVVLGWEPKMQLRKELVGRSRISTKCSPKIDPRLCIGTNQIECE